MCLGMPVLNACSFLRSENKDVASIADITYEVDSDGNTIITITYTDDREPDVFAIPKGVDGKEGNGIKSIDYDQDEAGYTTVNIVLEDGKEKSFTLAPGRSITGVYPVVDGDGNTILYFIDSNGNIIEPDPPIVIYKGDTGDPGIGIESIETVTNNNGSTTVTITLEDGSTKVFDIPPAKGFTGVSIDRNDDGDYVLTFNYSDGETSTVTFAAPPTWTVGSAKPSDSFGKNGDYFFDTEHDVIYVKQNGGWVEAVNFNTDDVTYSISFKLNDSISEPAEFVLGESFYSGIKRGETFYASDRDVPYPHRSNYTFVGWSTVSSNPKPTNGYFTDLTPVFSDMTLYAIWSQN